VFVDRDTPESYANEYDVKVRRLAAVLARTSDHKQSLGMAISRFEPGETVREHVNKPGVQEVFMILDGTVEVVIDGTVETLQINDVSYADIDQKHRFTNVGAGPAALLSIWWRTTDANTTV
jgi:mannose-6-phosphate isomerase-like protein (cupin superfamily)